MNYASGDAGGIASEDAGGRKSFILGGQIKKFKVSFLLFHLNCNVIRWVREQYRLKSMDHKSNWTSHPESIGQPVL